MPGCPTIGVLQAQVKAIRSKAPDAKVFGISSPCRWTGPAVHGEGANRLAVYQCDSPLQMRLALQEAALSPNVATTVLLTALEPTQISEDIMLRLALRRLHPVNSWEILRSLFKARHLDPRLTRHAFLADLLLEHADRVTFNPVAGGMLDAETAWEILLRERLGLTGAHPDLAELLRASAEQDLAHRWQQCPGELREAAAEWLTLVAGDTAGIVLRFLAGANGHLALAAGLAMGVIHHDAAGAELRLSAGWLYSWLGMPAHDGRELHPWRDAAAACLRNVGKPALRRCIEEAESLLRQAGAADHAWLSDELELGFELRLTRLAKAIVAHLNSRDTAMPAALGDASRSIRQHRLGRDRDRRLDRVAMAERLLRWLASRQIAADVGRQDLDAMARTYAADGGWVDWARGVLRGGEANQELALAYGRLVERVSEIRELENQRFAEALAAQGARGNPTAGLIPIEEVLDRVVVPLARDHGVLLLVVDGMSWAVFRELVGDLGTGKWAELTQDEPPMRLQGLAALPSVTEACRTSLLCGRLCAGQAEQERSGFAGHAGLLRVSANRPPKLFHKASLEGGDDTSLSADVRQALADARQRVVGIVINAVDDHLDKGDQLDAVWTADQIRVLRPILAEAVQAKRLVVLTADHGHLVDRQTEGGTPADGLRWRQASGPVVAGEALLQGPRVLLGDKGRVILAWSERLRYGARKNGYHGGASPQEMLVPISILWAESQPPAGLSELPADQPAWWVEGAARPVPVVVVPPMPTPIAALPPTPVPAAVEAPAAAAVAEEPTWIDRLLASEVYQEQLQMASRGAPPAATVRTLLQVLQQRGGTVLTPALAAATGLPPHRLPGLLANVRRLLNVDGYPILERQESTDTVVLNIPLLKKQFEIT